MTSLLVALGEVTMHNMRTVAGKVPKDIREDLDSGDTLRMMSQDQCDALADIEREMVKKEGK